MRYKKDPKYCLVPPGTAGVWDATAEFDARQTHLEPGRSNLEAD
jgi:hypothetical protein